MATNQDQLRASGMTSRREALKLAGVVAAGSAAVAMITGLPGAPVQAGPAQAAPVTAGRFSVEIDGVLVGGVESVDDIENESDIVEYTDGTDESMHFRPGNPKPGRITITKDWSNTHEFYNWRKAVLDGQSSGMIARKSISVIFYSDNSNNASRMNLYDCWPSKWVGPSLNPRSSAHATEALEIVYETIELK